MIGPSKNFNKSDKSSGSKKDKTTFIQRLGKSLLKDSNASRLTQKASSK